MLFDPAESWEIPECDGHRPLAIPANSGCIACYAANALVQRKKSPLGAFNRYYWYAEFPDILVVVAKEYKPDYGSHERIKKYQ